MNFLFWSLLIINSITLAFFVLGDDRLKKDIQYSKIYGGGWSLAQSAEG